MTITHEAGSNPVTNATTGCFHIQNLRLGYALLLEDMHIGWNSVSFLLLRIYKSVDGVCTLSGQSGKSQVSELFSDTSVLVHREP